MVFLIPKRILSLLNEDKVIYLKKYILFYNQ